ncbi:MAG TPA: DUF1360 domain-containing protein [Polyangia bacterium]|jgi:hypothetical protein|nr:DUF1360 domain-containing protein [Polyangia bacterium]
MSSLGRGSTKLNAAGLFQLVAVSLVVMGLAHTITRERITEPLRTRLGGKDTWLGYLVSCPYCVSHWIAFILVPLTGTYAIDVVPQWGPVSQVLRWFLSSVLIAVVAAFFRVIFYYVDETQGLIKRRQRLVDEEIQSESGYNLHS